MINRNTEIPKTQTKLEYSSSKGTENTLLLPQKGGLHFFDIASAIPDDLRADLCSSDGRLFVFGRTALAHTVLVSLREEVQKLSAEATLIVDFGRIHATADFVEVIIQNLYYPDTPWGRMTAGKQVVLANCDESALITVHRCLAAENTSCMAIEDAHEQEQPWRMLYVGHIERRLLLMLNYLRLKNVITPTELTKNALDLDDGSNRTSLSLNDASNRLRHLHEMGFLRRSQTTSPRGQRTYQYNYYHPYRHIEPDFTPEKLYTYQSPRLPRTKETKKVGADLTKDDEGDVSPGMDTIVTRRVKPCLGREKELTELFSLLHQDDTRLITLTGFGGVGKTQVALEVMRKIVRTEEKAVWFVPLDDIVTGEQIDGAILSALLATPAARAGDINEVIRILAERPSLLILDNFERLIPDGVSIIDKLYKEVPTLHILITSQIPLELPYEYEKRLRPLSAPSETDSLEVFQNHPSVQLLKYGSRGVFQITPDNAADVCKLCRRLDGLPLALELAASHLATMSPSQILVQLGPRFEMLSSQDFDKGVHHSLWATLNWSYSLLSPKQQEILRFLSIFPSGWTFETAKAVYKGADISELMIQLQERLLITVEKTKEEERFHMSEMLRSVTAQKLEQKEKTRLMGQLAGYFEQFIEKADKGIKGPNSGDWYRLLYREYANITGVLDWCLEDRRRNDRGLAITSRLTNFWGMAGLDKEGFRYSSRFIQAI